MADLKATSFRISEEDLEKFKQFMENEGIKTQADGFKSIMQSVEMAKAKNMITSRSKEIEVFQDTINNLMSYFLNSLNVNQTSEERIREELSKELQTKDNTISTMYEQLQELKADKINSDKNFNEQSDEIEEYKKTVKDWMGRYSDLRNDRDEKSKHIDVLTNNNINQLQQLDQYKDLKSINDKLVRELEQLKTDKSILDNDNKQLNDKVNNSDNMIKFYIDNIADLKKDVDTYKTDIKILEDKKDKQTEELKADHEKALQAQEKALHEQIKDKYDVDVAKKNLEIEKLNNIIEKLKSKEAKPATNKINK